MTDEINLELIIEGALFAAGEPLSIDRLESLFKKEEQVDRKAMRAALEKLSDAYMERGIELKEFASGYQFQVKPELAPWMMRLWEDKPIRYSRALLETLALIAYRQPITRGEIESIRGVSLSTTLFRSLLDREWVKVVGYRDVPGRPGLYATTKKFLDYFGLKNLGDLPALPPVQNLEAIAQKFEEDIMKKASEQNEQDVNETEQES
ncbi:MAG: SMC-Scp complex subunit ScpB [Pseudomonadota bacterium]|nr:SMC-Scp complex subunit ScpB [Gammaproteobacteria bacterium]MBU1628967.1 SMC-Scp complex subunit ScpB [Gammaproteobacteria bacterium]MBU1926796.1 SMC-Scp complex subunit ScpB [Gammaproteobacteria bacterium]MBU2546360.1 SMC-Scp complex subunit ScpB [Gammaproteobacteria bacterium]